MPRLILGRFASGSNITGLLSGLILLFSFLIFPSVLRESGTPRILVFWEKLYHHSLNPSFLTCFWHPQFITVLERKLQGVRNSFPPFAP